MRRRKQGTLRSGRSGKGGRVKSQRQAIAIGLSAQTSDSKQLMIPVRALDATDPARSEGPAAIFVPG